jgi:hypothetical protein
MIEHPTWVPIPPLELSCENHSCEIKYIPLSLAWAKTGHVFQGQSAGQGCIIPFIIVQPGNKQKEGICPGLLYMLLSQATDIGTEDDRTKSAIFFLQMI